MNVMFIHIPKAAGTSIEKSLGLRRLRFPSRFRREFKNEGQCSFGHLDVRKRLRNGRITKEFYDSAFKFCFCRNPYDRAVSSYFYARKRHPNEFSPSVSFIDFTRTLANYGRMFIEQTWYTDELDFDFIGRFETLERDFMWVAHKIGIKASLRKENNTFHEPYWTYYNEESIENIAKYYRKDFEFFGYNENDYFLTNG